MNGYSTWFPPNQVNKNMVATNTQNPGLANGLNFILLMYDVWARGRIPRIRILSNSANTPPNLLGMALRIA